MDIRIGNKSLAKKLASASTIKQAFGQMAPKVSQRKSEMEAMPNLAALIKLPTADCHPLTGNRDGDWAVKISPNFRMIFEIDQPLPLDDEENPDYTQVNKIVITGTEDYH